MSDENKLSPQDQIKSILADSNQRVTELEKQLADIPKTSHARLDFRPPGSPPSNYSFHQEQQKFELRKQIEEIKSTSNEKCHMILNSMEPAQKQATLKELKDNDLHLEQNQEKDEINSASDRFMSKLNQSKSLNNEQTKQVEVEQSPKQDPSPEIEPKSLSEKYSNELNYTKAEQSYLQMKDNSVDISQTRQFEIDQDKD